MGNSNSHDFSVITNYWFIEYNKGTLYNTPIGGKYFCFEMNMHTLRSNYNNEVIYINKSWVCCDEVTKLVFSVASTYIITKCEISILIYWINLNTQVRMFLLMIHESFFKMSHFKFAVIQSFLTAINFAYYQHYGYTNVQCSPCAK